MIWDCDVPLAIVETVWKFRDLSDEENGKERERESEILERRKDVEIDELI